MTTNGPRYRISQQADADLRSIAAYIRQFRPTAVAPVLDKLRETFSALAEHPGMGVACEAVGRGVRTFTPERPANRYVVFFRRTESPLTIEVVAVIDGRRDWQSLLSH